MAAMTATAQSRKADSAPGERLGADAGFTLIELLIVLGILALLAAITAPQVLRYLGKARTETAKIQINAISSALELYALDNGVYPPPQIGLDALMQQPAGATRWNGPYLKKAEGLIDPWGRVYRYRVPGPQRRLRRLHAGARQCARRNRRGRRRYELTRAGRADGHAGSLLTGAP